MSNTLKKGKQVKILKNIHTRGCDIAGLKGSIMCIEGDGTFWIEVRRNSMPLPFHLERKEFRVPRKKTRK